MDEIEPFIKLQICRVFRIPQRVQVSKFGLIHFSSLFRKDYNKHFEEQAWNAGYENGKHAMSYCPEIFEFKGNTVRRTDTENISYILAAVDRSK